MHDPRQDFIAAHGHYVIADSIFVFADGAMLEDTTWGRLIPPPEDKWEKAKIIAQYWLLISEKDEENFLAFKNYLGGTGKREDAWATLYTEDEQLAHLRTLQLQAKRSRARYMAANRKVKEHVPFWIEEREQQDIEDARRKQQFRERLDAFQL